jgi:hypothetical protein
MRIIISIIVIAVVIGVYMRFRKTLQRRIDNAISQTVFKQLTFLVMATGVAFGTIMLFIWIHHGNLKLHLLDWMYTYINPGSFFTSEGKEASDRGWAIVTGLTGMIFLSGLLISVFGNIIERRVDRVKNGKAYYAFNKHIVIIGYNQMSIGLIRRLAENDGLRDSEIVLQTIREVPSVRHELFSRLQSDIEKRVTIVSGNRTSVEDLALLNIHLCKEIFILGEQDEYDNDSLNVECVKQIDTILSQTHSGKPVRCNVLFKYQSTFSVFQRHDIEGINKRIDFVPFNYFEMWAQKVFVERKYASLEKHNAAQKVEYMPLDYKRITADSDTKVHLVVAGMSNMGIAIGMQAAHLCHFPNFVTKGIKTRITFIDEFADREMCFLKGRYRHLFNETEVYYKEVPPGELFAANMIKDRAARITAKPSKKIFTDIEFEFVKARLEYPVIQDYIAELSRNPNSCLTIAICFRYPPKAIAAGLYLPDEVYDNHISVLVQQDISCSTLELLAKDGKYMHVKPFGMLDNCYDLGKADDLTPMMVKYLYDHTDGQSEEIVKTFTPNELRANWNDWTEPKTGKESLNITALKWSNIYHANTIQVKKRSLNIVPGVELNSEQINLLARIEHNRWNIEKLLMGYRPCTPEEADDIANGRVSKQQLRDRFIHNDIKPYTALTTDDSDIQASAYDIAISKSLPYMLSEMEKIER